MTLAYRASCRQLYLFALPLTRPTRSSGGMCVCILELAYFIRAYFIPEILNFEASEALPLGIDGSALELGI